MTVSHILAIVIYVFLVAVVVSLGIWAAPIPAASVLGWTFLLGGIGIGGFLQIVSDVKKSRLERKPDDKSRDDDIAFLTAKLEEFPEQFKQAMLNCGPIVTQGVIRMTFKDSSSSYHRARRYLDDGHLERAFAEYESACRYLRLGQKYAAEMVISHHSARM